MIIVHRYRVKSLIGLLNRQALLCNFVWNYCNDIQRHALKWNKRWPTGFDLNNLTAGSSKELGLHSGTIKAVCEQYAKSRTRSRRPYLRWRGKRSLGWVPFKGPDIRREGAGFRFHGKTFRVFNSRDLPAGKITDGGGFSCDNRGNWFLNIPVELDASEARCPVRAIGIDLGLKDFATLSTGEKISSPHHFSILSEKLGRAQRAGKRRHARKIHARIRNSRADFLHKLSYRIVRDFDYIAVGNISPRKLAKTRMAKSVSDASWSSFRNMLRYKAIAHGAWFEEVDEKFSTQVCSSCGALPDSRPKGIADLGIRQWACSSCGVVHDRDTNAAINLLARSGHRAPVEGVSVLWAEEMSSRSMR